MPPNVNMDLIREALARRASGGLGGGTTIPATSQITNVTPGVQAPAPVVPTNPLVQGGQTPVASGPTQQANPQAQPQRAPQQGGQNANFDDGTKATAKALIARLVRVL